MQEAGIIEEKMQRRADEKPEMCKKKQRCVSPSPEVSGSTVSKTLLCDEGKGKLKRNKGGSQETGNDENKSEKAPKCPKHAPETQA